MLFSQGSSSVQGRYFEPENPTHTKSYHSFLAKECRSRGQWQWWTVRLQQRSRQLPYRCSVPFVLLKETFEPKYENNCRTVRTLLCTPPPIWKKKPSYISDRIYSGPKKEQTKSNITFSRWRDLITFWCDRFYWGFVHFESSQPSRADRFLQKCPGLVVGHHYIEGHLNHHRKRTFPVVHRKQINRGPLWRLKLYHHKRVEVVLLTPIPAVAVFIITWDLKYPSQSLMIQMARAFCGVQSTAARNIYM